MFQGDFIIDGVPELVFQFVAVAGKLGVNAADYALRCDGGQRSNGRGVFRGGAGNKNKLHCGKLKGIFS